jgi:hypothetical protein
MQVLRRVTGLASAIRGSLGTRTSVSVAEDEPFDDLFLVFLDLNLMAAVISLPMSSEQVEVDPVLIVSWIIEKTGFHVYI